MLTIATNPPIMRSIFNPIHGIYFHCPFCLSLGRAWGSPTYIDEFAVNFLDIIYTGIYIILCIYNICCTLCRKSLPALILRVFLASRVNSKTTRAAGPGLNWNTKKGWMDSAIVVNRMLDFRFCVGSHRADHFWLQRWGLAQSAFICLLAACAGLQRHMIAHGVYIFWYFVAWGSVTFWWHMQLLHVLHVHSLRLAPQCRAFV